MAYWYLIVLLIAAVGIATFGFSYTQPATLHPLPTQLNAPTSPQGSTAVVQSTTTSQGQPAVQDSSTTADWKTYQNTEFGFAIQYPKDFRVDDNKAKKDGPFLQGHLVSFAPKHFDSEEFSGESVDVSLDRSGKASCFDNGGIQITINGLVAWKTQTQTVGGVSVVPQGNYVNFTFCPPNNQRAYIYSVGAFKNTAANHTPDLLKTLETMVRTFQFAR